jgi:hypothetical protein
VRHAIRMLGSIDVDLGRRHTRSRPDADLLALVARSKQHGSCGYSLRSAPPRCDFVVFTTHITPTRARHEPTG